MQKTTNYQLPRWEKTDRILMDDFNGMTAALAAKGNCRIQAGSYTGTGTYGTNGKSTLTFSFTPHIVILNTGNPDPYSDVPRYFMLLRPAAQYLFDRNHTGGLTWGEKSVAWNSDDAEHQFNENGKTYHYIAIGTV